MGPTTPYGVRRQNFDLLDRCDRRKEAWTRARSFFVDGTTATTGRPHTKSGRSDRSCQQSPYILYLRTAETQELQIASYAASKWFRRRHMQLVSGSGGVLRKRQACHLSIPYLGLLLVLGLCTSFRGRVTAEFLGLSHWVTNERTNEHEGGLMVGLEFGNNTNTSYQGCCYN
jgi:hypothetical protein